MSNWFEQLFGFEEGPYQWTQRQFEVDGPWLTSKHADRRYQFGHFSTPTISELRQSVKRNVGPSTLSHEVVGDALLLHADPANAGDMFQVASQFNALEFPSPEMTPEDGISDYQFDATQGPACSLAAAAGTVYRNYLVTMNGHRGQTAQQQINNLHSLENMLSGGPYWQVTNGYVESSEQQLTSLAVKVRNFDRDDLVGVVRIGLQSQTEVTFCNRFEVNTEPHLVNQAYCSAISCGYSQVETHLWEPIATIALDAAYEGTLLAAAALRDQGLGTGRVWLTFIGGGVFGNKSPWIKDAISRSIKRTSNLGLNIIVCHFRSLRPDLMELGL